MKSPDTGQIPELDILRFSAEAEGPLLLVTGGIHGSEPCGPAAIRRVLDDIAANRITLGKGGVTFIPKCNPEALKRGARFVNTDLNRDMRPKNNPRSYEDHLCNQICPEIEKSDAVLDVHSYEAGGPAFVFLGPADRAEFDFATAIGGEYFIHSWQKAYAQGQKDAGMKAPSGTGPKKTPTTVKYYAKEKGATALTVECGKNGDPQAETVAYNAILNALEYWNDAVISPEIKRMPRMKSQKIIALKTAFFKTAAMQATQAFDNFAELKKGDLIAAFEDGTALRAAEDGYAVLPYKTPPVGEKILIFGVEQSAADYLAATQVKQPRKKARHGGGTGASP